MPSKTCASCNHVVDYNYCANCGEKILTPELRSVGHIAGDALENLTSYDGKIWRTLITLFVKPGQLDRNYHIGQRVNYLKPISLFFIINVLFVMFSPLTDFYVAFRDQMQLQPYSDWLKPYMLEVIANKGYEIGDFEEKYNQLVVVLARSLIILQVPFFAIFSFIVLFSRKHYLSDYLIFSLNAHSWWMIWIIVAQVPAWFIGNGLSLICANLSVSYFYFLLLPIGKFIYLSLAIKTLFKFSWLRVLLSVPIMMGLYIVAHYIFRFLQLFITYSLIE
ncbi:MAG: DUF3667 domain-containing protein [Kangiellaceae bacterium]|nr:DUF3667 domain-containing protein [Kangiellaceae bacterium]